MNSSCVTCIVPGTVRLDFSNCSTKCSYSPKIWRNLANFFYFCDKIFETCGPQRYRQIDDPSCFSAKMWTIRLSVQYYNSFLERETLPVKIMHDVRGFSAFSRHCFDVKGTNAVVKTIVVKMASERKIMCTPASVIYAW